VESIVVMNFLDGEATFILICLSYLLHDELNDETFNVNDPSNFKTSVPAYGSDLGFEGRWITL